MEMGSLEIRKTVNNSLLKDPPAFCDHIRSALNECCVDQSLLLNGKSMGDLVPSSVMLLLSEQPSQNGRSPEVCVILNKRSKQVRQSGDLCCPGGRVEAHLDPYLARMLMLPGSPLSRWPSWSGLRKRDPQEAKFMSLHLATGLREAWEEMRLNPFRVQFLGPLPPQRLMLFRRLVYPMVAWVPRQKRFVTSWEVERIVLIPVSTLLNESRYARYRLYVTTELGRKYNTVTRDFPCFLHLEEGRKELLWGATYRIVTFFLQQVFGFIPPDMHSLPVVPGILSEEYILGGACPVEEEEAKTSDQLL
jgi:8-oxo-dGTP pyrophosphatase MutT (NUDIX family)